MPAPRYSTAHRRLRAALYRQLRDGTPCARCGHPMHPRTEHLALDHTDDGTSYLGFSHDSPCGTCGERCNSAAGGRHRARNAGEKLRDRRCVICGMPYRAGSGSDGAKQATCGQQNCITALRRIRHLRQPDPEPPEATGRDW